MRASLLKPPHEHTTFKQITREATWNRPGGFIAEWLRQTDEHVDTDGVC